MLSILVALVMLVTPNSLGGKGNHFGWRNRGPLAPPPPPAVEQVSNTSGGGGSYLPDPAGPAPRYVTE